MCVEADVEEFIVFGLGSSFISDCSLFFSKLYVHLQLSGVSRTCVFIDLTVSLSICFCCYALLAFRLEMLFGFGLSQCVVLVSWVCGNIILCLCLFAIVLTSYSWGG